VVTLQSNQAMVTSNVNIVLVNAGSTGGTSLPPTQGQAAEALPPSEPTSQPPAPSVDALPLAPLRGDVTTDGGDLAAHQISLSVPAGVVGPSGGEVNLL